MPTLLSLPASTVLPAGSFTSSNFTFAAGINSVTIQFQVAPADLIDTTKQMTLGLWRFNGSIFVLDSGFTWQGNSLDDNGQPAQPFIVLSAGPLSGVQCQLRLALSKAIQSGLLITSA